MVSRPLVSIAERVRKEWLALVSRKITGWYWGWMPCFIAVSKLRKGADYTEKSGQGGEFGGEFRARFLATPHRIEELGVGLGGFQLVDQEFGRLELVHREEQLPQDPDLLQERGLDQQLLAPRAGAVHVDGRIDALLVHPAIEVDLHVAGALEFLVDHVVHAAAGVDQRSRYDRQRSTFFNVASGAEKPLGLLQAVLVEATAEHLAGGGHHGVVGAGQAGEVFDTDGHLPSCA